jgi:predicted 3-demethylubiquinone-9 3-methyltransferase (glyoxalase superfamily)
MSRCFPIRRSPKVTVERYPSDVPAAGKGRPEVMTVGFELDGQAYTALNGGPHFTFTEAVSFVVHCADQAEVDRYWDALTADGGKESQCGWLKDKYGLSWQIVPQELLDLIPAPTRPPSAGCSRP